MASTERYKYWRIRKTLIELCHDRNYLVAANELEMTEEEFGEKYGNSPEKSDLEIFVQKKDDQSEKMFCFFPDVQKGKVTPEHVKKFSMRMEQHGANRAIIVVEHGCTPAANNSMNETLRALQQYFEVFQEKELMCNITNHEFVPQHEAMTQEEKVALLKRYKMKASQLPRIKKNDPIARYYGLSAGQVVKITRTSETAGRYVTYRMVG